MATSKWPGKSGKEYIFEVYDSGSVPDSLPSGGGNYIFVKQGEGSKKALYIGRTGNFKTRPVGPGHEKWSCAKGEGLNKVHVRREADENERKRIENDLLARRDPPCNRQQQSTS